MIATSAGGKIALAGCLAWDEDNAVRVISGLFTLAEREVVDHAAHITEAGWWIGSEAGDYYFVADADLWPQVDPKGWGRFLAAERDDYFHQESYAD